METATLLDLAPSPGVLAGSEVLETVVGGASVTITAQQVATIATTASALDAQARVDALNGGAPTDLNRLVEIAAAINNDPVYHTTVDDALATKTDSDDLANVTDVLKGASLVGYLSEGSSSVGRPLSDKLQERISPFDKGALGNANYSDGSNWFADAGLTIPAADDSAAILTAIAKLAAQGGGVLDLCGRRFLATNIYITDKYITIENGTLVNCSLLIGPANQVPDGFMGAMQDWRDMFLTIHQVKFEFPFVVTASSPNRRYDPRPSTNNPIKMQRSALVTVDDCDFINCNACVSSVAKDVFQHVRQFTITNNRVNYCNYIWYGDYIDVGTNLLQHGDCNISDNIAIVCLISHIVFQGQDGWIVKGNTFFFPSYPFTYSLKKQNISAYKCAHGMISANQMFEAGEEAILFSQCGRSSVVNNQIIWPGQRLECSAIRYTGGSLSSDEYLLGTVSGNVIWDATKFGIEFESGEGHVTVTGNTIRGTGTTTFYYGPTKVQAVGYAIYASSGSKKVNATGNTSDTPNFFAAVGGWYSSNIEAPDANVAYARTMSSKLTLTNNATTIDVTHYDTLALVNTAATTIANFVFSGNFAALPSAQMDRELTLIAFNGNTTVANGTFVKLAGEVNRTIANNGTMKLRYYAGIWYEV